MSDHTFQNELLKKEFLEVARKHFELKTLLDQSIKSIKKVDKMVENDLEEHFQTWIPLTNNMYLFIVKKNNRVKYKEGIHFPMINKLFRIIRENESLVNQAKMRRQQYFNDMRKTKADKMDELSEDFEDIDDK
jgi:hypothetical protein